MKDEALTLLNEEGSAAAVAYLKSGDDPILAMDGFNRVALACYNDLRDVAQAVDMFEAGIAFGEAAAAETQDADQQYEIMSKVKALNYNLGANTWPGWGDGITVTEFLMGRGALAAQRNLALAMELDKGEMPLSRAYWLVGAHDLAAGALPSAREHFQLAQLHALQADADADVLLSKGYELVVDQLDGNDVSEAWAEVLESLREFEHAEFFIDQLKTAWAIFTA